MHQNQRTTGRWSGLPSAREFWQVLRWSLAVLVVGTIVSVITEAPLWTHATFAATVATLTIIYVSRDLWIPAVLVRLPTRHTARLWLRDHWRRFLAIIPLGVASFLAWYFWPWGLGLAALVLFAYTISAISWQRVRKGYGGMEFPHQTVLRAEGHHPLAFLVFGWEWGILPEWGAPKRGEGEERLNFIVWLLGTVGSRLGRVLRDIKSWPIIFAATTAVAIRLDGPEVFVSPKWWFALVWAAGLLVATNYWWRFATFVWPAYRVVLTDETIVVVYPVRGALGTIDIAAPEIPLMRIGHWQTTRRALGGGDWDPAFVFGRENVILRWLKDPEGFKQAALEQLELLQAQQRQR